jgi:hypothetical protein
MKLDNIPQDDSILEGNRRACYAQDADGRYVLAPSRGWSVEAIANRQALADVEARIAAALEAVRAGRASPLAYHMARCHMDARLLAAYSGIFSLRVRRHMRPAVFARLPDRLLQRYADALGMTLATLKTLPDSP